MAFFAIMSVKSQSIQGKVYDENGITMPGAVVLLEGYNRNQLTDEDGAFRFGKLRAHKYTVIAQIVGYKPKSVEVDLSIEANQNIDIKLESNVELREVEVFGERYKQPEKLDAITRMPLRPSEQIQSISVISEVVIAEQGALTINDVVKNVPGVTLFGSYGGVRESLSTRGYRGVPILKNGVRTDSDFRTASLSTDMQGVESIQVIKGSAAITQGVGNDLGSPGGVINVVTKTPKFKNEGEVGARVGSWGQARGFFDTQSVLDKNKTVAFRMNGAYERGDGFKRLAKSNRIYINPSLEWRPNEKTTVTLEMDYMDDDRTPDVGTVNLAKQDVNALYKDAREKYFGFTSDNVNNKTLTYAARFTRQLSDNFSVRAAYFGSSYKVDNTSSSLSVVDDKPENGLRNRSLGNSLRNDRNSTLQLDLIGRDIYTGSVKHTFQLGFDYKRNNLETINYGYWGTNKKGESSFVTSLPIDQIDVFANPNDISNILEMPKLINGKVYEWKKGDPVASSASNYGLMVQDVTTFNEYLKAIIGLRYSYGRSRDNAGTGVVTGDAWNPMAGIMISPIKNVNLFASFTTTTSLRSAAQKMREGGEIGPSTSRQWETGIKSDWLDNRLRFNFTYFHILNKNLSATEYIEGTNQTTGYYYKAGNLKRQGIEVELNGRILENLQVMLGYAYLKAEYKNSPMYVDGSAPMNAPTHTANGWIQYTVNRSALRGLTIGIGTYYVGDRPVNEYSLAPDGHGTPVGTKPFDMPAYVTVNTQLGYTYGKLTARVFFNNIFDEIGYNSYFRGGYINQIDPRNFAGVITYKF